jgi:hypothetical protein
MCLTDACGGAAAVTSVALATTPLLTLPQSFGDIYLGETLSAYVSTCNQAPYPLVGVQVKVEVQTSTQRQLLLNRSGTGPGAGLSPAGRADCIVRYELREIGVHILIVSASFVDADGESRNLRKFFKFQVLNPLSMKSKSHTLAVGTAAENVLVETQVQNSTQAALYLTSVQFAPAQSLAVDDLNTFETRLDQLACLRPGDVQQYMYRLRAQPGAPADVLRSASALGRMDVHWRGPMTETGHLQSNLVQRRQPPPRAIEVRLLRLVSAEPVPRLLADDAGGEARGDGIESLVALCEVPFTVSARLTNYQQREVDLKFFWIARQTQPHQPQPPIPTDASGAGVGGVSAPPKPALLEQSLIHTGVSGTELGVLAPRGSIDISLELVALTPGLHRLTGLVLHDRRAGVTHDAGVIGELIVLNADDGLAGLAA